MNRELVRTFFSLFFVNDNVDDQQRKRNGGGPFQPVHGAGQNNQARGIEGVESKRIERERERERDIRQETVVFAGGSFGGHVGPNMSRLIVTPSATINRNVLGGNYPQNMERRQGIVNCRENSGRTRKNSDRWRVSYIPTPFGLDSID